MRGTETKVKALAGGLLAGAQLLLTLGLVQAREGVLLKHLTINPLVP